MEFPKWCLLFIALPVALVAVRADEYEETDIGDHAYDGDVADQGDPNTNEDGDLAEIDKAAVGRWYGIRKISFMAYLSRDHNYMTHGQLVKFNTVLLNDGNAYNVHTGIFSAPVNGVYQFSFVIAQKHTREISANLMVSGRYIVGAVAEGRKFFHDVQGYNTAIVYVAKGQSVYVQIQGGNNIEGDTLLRRYTTFSGHIVYPRL